MVKVWANAVPARPNAPITTVPKRMMGEVDTLYSLTVGRRIKEWMIEVKSASAKY